MENQVYYNKNQFKTITAAEWELPRGFESAFIANSGADSAILTDYKGQQMILAAGEAIGFEKNGKPYYEILIDATLTTVKVGYIEKSE